MTFFTSGVNVFIYSFESGFSPVGPMNNFTLDQAMSSTDRRTVNTTENCITILTLLLRY